MLLLNKVKKYLLNCAVFFLNHIAQGLERVVIQMKNTIKFIAEERQEVRAFFRTAIPVAAALVLFLASAAYIVFRTVSNQRYNERWKDYDECGLS